MATKTKARKHKRRRYTVVDSKGGRIVKQTPGKASAAIIADKFSTRTKRAVFIMEGGTVTRVRSRYYRLSGGKKKTMVLAQ